uniref:Uncharacterized protein n=1 Tax=Anguilla anguilla TaxID=7936 RepID=A0A0E9TYK6_ANGAN
MYTHTARTFLHCVNQASSIFQKKRVIQSVVQPSVGSHFVVITRRTFKRLACNLKLL